MRRQRAALWAAAVFGALAAMFAAGCAGRHDLEPSPGEVRVEVAHVGFDHQSGAHYVLLEDLAGKRELQILIGEEEARAIMFEMHGVKPERPLTHDLLRDIIERTGNHVDRVVITSVHDQIYYADIYLDRGRLRLDSRPSDAIALAMGMDAPIFVNGKLFQPATALQQRPPSGNNLPVTFTAEGVVVQELSATLASYFGMPPRSGVLVAAVAGPAARAGLERGDIVMAVERHPVRTPTDFIAAMAAFKDRPHIAFTVMRERRTHTITVMREKVARRGG